MDVTLYRWKYSLFRGLISGLRKPLIVKIVFKVKKRLCKPEVGRFEVIKRIYSHSCLEY